MADVEINYSCGCGFKTKRLEAAVEHSDTQQHTLTVLGTIKGFKPAPSTNTSKPRARTAKDQFKQGLENTPGISRIEELRQKLNRR